MKKKKLRLFGFTLAEVLIVVGIIGIVASLTIPNLIQNQKQKTIVVSLKKAYTTISQAYLLAVNDNGTPDTWNLVGLKDPGGAENMLNVLATYFKNSKNCGRNPDCMPDVTYKYLNNTTDSNSNFNQRTDLAKAKLVDGSLLFVMVQDPACGATYGPTQSLKSVCGFVYFDVNGYKTPNKRGEDVFGFYITKYGIIPYGTVDDTLQPFSTKCLVTSNTGWGCTAWVLYNENTEYLNCTGLSWNGPTKCN